MDSSRFVAVLLPVAVRRAFVGAYDAISFMVLLSASRRMYSGYSGDILRLRRASDNAEQDMTTIANGRLNVAAVSSFLTATTGYVVTVYDQSGNGNNATNSTASQQPTYTNDADGVRPLHDRSNDLVAIASLDAGTYTVGIATWSAAQVFVHKQNTTGSYSLNPADAYDYVIINNPALSAGELSALQTALQTSRPAVNSADVLRLWSSSTSVNLAVTETGDAGLTWEAGDGQTGSGTTFVKTLGAAPDWVILRAATKNRITQINWGTKNLFGQLGDLSGLTALTLFYCNSNQLTGSIPSLTANTALTLFRCFSNQLTGSIPSLTANTALTQFYCDTNQLTGSIPSLTANTLLTLFSCPNNQLTGSIPSLTTNTALATFSCPANQLTGSIPSLAANIALATFYCHTNQLTGYTGGGVSITLGDFQAQNNLLTQAAVDAILADFVAANKTTGTRVLNLGGTGNATPSAAGLLDKATLVSRGWTVTTN